MNQLTALFRCWCWPRKCCGKYWLFWFTLSASLSIWLIEIKCSSFVQCKQIRLFDHISRANYIGIELICRWFVCCFCLFWFKNHHNWSEQANWSFSGSHTVCLFTYRLNEPKFMRADQINVNRNQRVAPEKTHFKNAKPRRRFFNWIKIQKFIKGHSFHRVI